MNRSRPVGSLGGGGWEAGSVDAAYHEIPDKKKKDKVLADMYEMFLDSLEPEIIQSVVCSFNYNDKKSIDALLDMCGSKDSQSISSPASKKERPTEGNHQTPTSVAAFPIQDEREQPPPLSSILSSRSRVQEKGPNILNGIPFKSTIQDKTARPQSPRYFSTAITKKSQEPHDKMAKIRWYIENGHRLMVLMRGCPGSGKSYLAEGIIQRYKGNPQDHVFSTDSYFVRNGIYKFDLTCISAAHEANQKKVLTKAREGWSPIIVDNTHTQLWEMTPYATIAVNNGYAIEILEPETAWFGKLDELSKRNSHAVPRDKIKAMLERYETGITVERLLLSTGAKYSKSIPQPAEHSLIIQKSTTSETQGLTQSLNQVPTSARREINSENTQKLPILAKNEQKFVSAFPSANNLLSGDSPKLKEPPDTSYLQDGFYFGPKSSNLRLNLFHANPVAQELQSPGESDLSHEVIRDSLSGSSHHESNLQEDKLPLGKLLRTAVQSENSRDNIATTQKQTSKDYHNPDPKSGYDLETKSKQNSDKGSALAFNFSQLNGIVNDNSGNVFSSISDPAPKSVDSPAKSYGISSLTDLASSTPMWAGTSSWSDDAPKSHENIQQNPLPKPPRAFSMKNIEDYCNTVKGMNAASKVKDWSSTSQTEASGWSICENSGVSWQPVDKLQEDAFKRERSPSHNRFTTTAQRTRFNQPEVVEKATNTHHADFCVLNNVSSVGSMEGSIIINGHDRDINEGRCVLPNKPLIKLMLDKGTLTENDFEGEIRIESKQEKIKELVRLFPNRSVASIKELLKQCEWDLNYVSNLLLDDTDNDPFGTDPNNDNNEESHNVDSDEESLTQKPSDENDLPAEDINVNLNCAIDDSSAKALSVQEVAEEVKRHIEQSIDFDERCYSPHTLAIKNFRRGVKEGAIPKSNTHHGEQASGSPIVETAPPTEVAKILAECNPDQGQTTPDSSDEDSEALEFIVSHDFMQQLMDKFGGTCRVTDVSPVVKFPVNLARQIYDTIFSGTNILEEEEDDGDFAMKLQCEEDEKLARLLYDQMRSQEPRSELRDPPRLREIMDMELAQAIYKADVDSLTQNPQETMANVLAKRLLEENYSHIDKRTLHDIFVSCNYSFEDTVKTLQEALSTDSHVINSQKSAIQQSTSQSCPEKTPQKEYKCVEESIGIENPWDLSDPAAHYEKYREKADQFLKERDEMYRKASDAFRRQERSAAAYYSKLGELIGKKYHHANSLAAAALAASHTNSHSSETLDLHHFKVVEAVTVFDLFVDYHIGILAEKGLQQQSLDIITGRGTHSVNGKARIKPAIISRIKVRNLRHQSIPNNPGVLKVFVSANSFLAHEIRD